MDELTELRLQIAEGVTKLTARLNRLDVSVFVLRGAISSLMKPEKPEVAEQTLEKIEQAFAQVEVHLRDNRELLQQIRKIRESA